ncbi:MAG: DUF6517 family protein [Haloferacaceae archaeon]
MRRQTLLTVTLALLVALAGCGGGETDDGPIVAEASPATVDEAALSATGYEFVERSNRTTNATVAVSLQGDIEVTSTFAVRATTTRAVYERQTGAGRAVVGVRSVPGVKPSEALAAPRNPFAGREVTALATNATGVAVRDARPTANGTVVLFGNETTLRRYEATAGGDSPVTVSVARARRGGDFVYLVAVVPRSADERDRIARLAGGVRHASKDG